MFAKYVYKERFLKASFQSFIGLTKHLFSSLRSGWKLNSDDKWVKVENAEFDSDEDEPPEFKGRKAGIGEHI